MGYRGRFTFMQRDDTGCNEKLLIFSMKGARYIELLEETEKRSGHWINLASVQPKPQMYSRLRWPTSNKPAHETPNKPSNKFQYM